MNRNSKLTAWFVALALGAGMMTGLGAVAPAFGQAEAVELGPVTGSVANGRELYNAHGCYMCHGFTGETRVPLVGNDTPVLRNEESFLTFLRLRADQAPLNASASMPNYSAEVLNDRQAKDVYAFVRSLRSNTPELQDIPALNLIIESASRP